MKCFSCICNKSAYFYEFDGVSHIPISVIINSACVFGSSGEKSISKCLTLIGVFETVAMVGNTISLFNFEIINRDVTRLLHARPKLGKLLFRIR